MSIEQQMFQRDGTQMVNVTVRENDEEKNYTGRMALVVVREDSGDLVLSLTGSDDYVVAAQLLEILKKAVNNIRRDIN